MWIRVRKPWEFPGLRETPEEVYWNRRKFLKRLGLAGVAWGFGLGGAACGSPSQDEGGREAKEGAQGTPSGSPRPKEDPAEKAPPRSLYPAKRNPKYKLDRKLTPERYVAGYNNFYEFSFRKDLPRILAQRMETSPWKVEIRGLVERPLTLDVDDLLRRFPLEERLYRFRCVEAWAMAVPWTGFPLKKLIDFVRPLAAAKYVRFVTFNRPDWGPGFRYTEYPWPYHEGLTIEEAANELTLLVTGLYGKPLPKQNGAPIRLIVPWKYGFKSIKSIVRIEFVSERPPTFWSSAIPQEYDFWANVDPAVPHPRWSQKYERLIDTGEVVPTLPFNGYGEYVAHLYKKQSGKKNG